MFVKLIFFRPSGISSREKTMELDPWTYVQIRLKSISRARFNLFFVVVSSTAKLIYFIAQENTFVYLHMLMQLDSLNSTSGSTLNRPPCTFLTGNFKHIHHIVFHKNYRLYYFVTSLV